MKEKLESMLAGIILRNGSINDEEKEPMHIRCIEGASIDSEEKTVIGLNVNATTPGKFLGTLKQNKLIVSVGG